MENLLKGIGRMNKETEARIMNAYKWMGAMTAGIVTQVIILASHGPFKLFAVANIATWLVWLVVVFKRNNTKLRISYISGLIDAAETINNDNAPKDAPTKANKSKA